MLLGILGFMYLQMMIVRHIPGPCALTQGTSRAAFDRDRRGKPACLAINVLTFQARRCMQVYCTSVFMLALADMQIRRALHHLQQ